MKLPSLFENYGADTGSQIAWVSSNSFFTKTIQVPEGVAAEEVASFIELEIEELSPFPLDQLVWGYFMAASQRVAFAFATVKPRVPSQVLDQWEDWTHVYPSFMHLVDTRVTEPTIKGLWHDSVVSLVYYNGQSPYPTAFEHEWLEPGDDQAEENITQVEAAEPPPLPASQASSAGTDNDVAQALAAYARLQAAFGVAGIRVEEGLLVVAETVVTDNAVTLQIERITDPNQASLLLEPVVIAQNNGLWSAELRSSEFIEKRLKAIDFERKLWQGYKITGWVAVLVIFLSLSNLVFDVLVDRRNDRYEKQVTAAAEISVQIGYLENLQRFSGQQFRPRHIFEELNKERVKAIYFKNMEARVEDNVVQVQGIAKNVKQVNDYVERLLKSGNFAKDFMHSSTRSKGDVQFNMKLFYTPAPVEAPLDEAELVPAEEDPAAMMEAEI